MRILVIGGMHGNEPLGTLLVERLLAKPIRGVDGVIANEMAFRARSRFIEQDMNRSFPGIRDSHEYEHRRPYQLLKMAKKYDLVIDFHNTHCPNNDCGFVGTTANELLYGVAAQFGLKHVIVADYDCMNKYANNCLSVEVSLSSPLNNANTWYEMIAKLAELSSHPKLPSSTGIKRYRFVYRMTLDDKERYGLDKKNLNAFVRIDPKISKELGIKDPAYPIFIDDAYTPYNFGGLLNKIE